MFPIAILLFASVTAKADLALPNQFSLPDPSGHAYRTMLNNGGKEQKDTMRGGSFVTSDATVACRKDRHDVHTVCVVMLKNKK